MTNDSLLLLCVKTRLLIVSYSWDPYSWYFLMMKSTFDWHLRWHPSFVWLSKLNISVIQGNIWKWLMESPWVNCGISKWWIKESTFRGCFPLTRFNGWQDLTAKNFGFRVGSSSTTRSAVKATTTLCPKINTSMCLSQNGPVSWVPFPVKISIVNAGSLTCECDKNAQSANCLAAACMFNAMSFNVEKR